MHRLRAKLLHLAQIKLHHQADLSRASWKLRQSRLVTMLDEAVKCDGWVNAREDHC